MSEPSIERKAGAGEHFIYNLLNWAPPIGCLIVGAIGLMGSLRGLEGPNNSMSLVAGGLYLIGAAIGFGMMFHATLRKD